MEVLSDQIGSFIDALFVKAYNGEHDLTLALRTETMAQVQQKVDETTMAKPLEQERVVELQLWGCKVLLSVKSVHDEICIREAAVLNDICSSTEAEDEARVSERHLVWLFCQKDLHIKGQESMKRNVDSAVCKSFNAARGAANSQVVSARHCNGEQIMDPIVC